MSEPERSEHGAITESATLLPGYQAGVTPDAPEVERGAEPADSESTNSDVKPAMGRSR